VVLDSSVDADSDGDVLLSAGIQAAAIVLIVVALLVAVFILLRRRRKLQQKHEQQEQILAATADDRIVVQSDGAGPEHDLVPVSGKGKSNAEALESYKSAGASIRWGASARGLHK
jgi:membrane protein implicated in regulation of membrane protease activity